MKDPVRPVMSACLSLARADTGASVLDWYEVPIVELYQWGEVITEAEKLRKRRMKK